MPAARARGARTAARLAMRRTASAIMLWIAASTAFAVEVPYLFRQPSGDGLAHWLAPDGARDAAVPVAGRVTVPSVGATPSFEVTLRPPASPAADAVTTHAHTPVLVVADTHGEYTILVELLQRQGVVDDHLRWKFGTGHLVVLGDVFARGAHHTEILWLLYQLEAEAAAAGGGAYLLLGNHEARLLQGDAGALHPRYADTARMLGMAAYPALFGPGSVLGQWLRTRASVMRLDNLLLVHGGLSLQWIARDLSIGQVNAAVRDALATTGTAPASPLGSFVLGAEGPLFYRGYFSIEGRPAEATADDVHALLHHIDADVMLVGHTRVPSVTPLYAGKVIAVQVYPTRDAMTGEAHMEAVLRLDGTLHRVGIDGRQDRLP